MVAKKSTGMVKSKVPRAKKTGGSAPASVSLVKKLISKHVETKLVGTHSDELYNQYINTTGDLIPLIPIITQGTTDNQRVGNKISPKSLVVSVTLTLRKDVLQAPNQVILPRIFVVQQRNTLNMDTQIALGGDQTHLLDDGVGQRAFLGTVYDYHSPVCREVFKVMKDIKTKLGNGQQEENGMITRTFRFTLKCPPVLYFGDNQAYPRNFAPVMYIGYAKPDNTTDPITTTGLQGIVSSTLYFEDA